MEGQGVVDGFRGSILPIKEDSSPWTRDLSEDGTRGHGWVWWILFFLSAATAILRLLWQAPMGHGELVPRESMT